jgi:hypothetical protein
MILAVAFAATALASPSYAQQGAREISRAHARAIQECSSRAAPYWEWKWGDYEIYVYGACMAEHGQPK